MGRRKMSFGPVPQWYIDECRKRHNMGPVGRDWTKVSSNKTGNRRKRLLARQGNVCAECGEAMLLEWPKDGVGKSEMATIDHVIPRSHGGTSDLSNLELVHLRCNQKRNKAFQIRSVMCRFCRKRPRQYIGRKCYECWLAFEYLMAGQCGS